MKFNMRLTTGLLAVILTSGSLAQEGCNEQFPDLSKATGLNSTGKATAEKCQDTAKKVPSCAYQCLENAAANNTCNFWDFGCQCTTDKQNAIRAATIPCVIKDCPIETALLVQRAALDICTCAGYPTTMLGLPELVTMSGLPGIAMRMMGSYGSSPTDASNSTS